MNAPRCDVRRPGGRLCPGVLTFHTDTLGRVHWTCPRCARRHAGRCADCPCDVDGQVGKAERCARCRKRKAARDNALSRAREPERLRRRSKLWHRQRRSRDRNGQPPLTPHAVGLRAGAARAAALTPERRTEIARLAVTARWDRVRAARQAAA